MVFLFNPHRHVKIWLSGNEEVFMPLVNQLRLIHMRLKNPSAVISFIFDSTLLNHKAIEQCFRFCHQHRVQAYDAQSLIMRCTSNEEIQLRKLYLDEIHHLDKGGNLGSASDKLRLLSPIYQLGTYTDFDVTIETEGLPQIIPLQQPLLLHISSHSKQKDDTNEFISVNNDCLLIADEIAALPLISKIQQIGIFLSNKQNPTNPNQAYLANDINEIKLQNLLQNLSYHQSARVMRHSIIKLCRSNDTFYRFLLANNELLIKADVIGFPSTTMRPNLEHFNNFAASIRFQLEHIVLTSTNTEQIREIQNILSKKDNNALLDFFRHQSLEQLIRTTVIDTLGPQAYMLGLFQTNYFSKIEVDKKIRLFTLEHYGLDQHFITTNTTKLHLSSAQKQAHLKNSNNDLSWMSFGQEKLLFKAEQITKAVLKLQHSWLDKHPRTK